MSSDPIKFHVPQLAGRELDYLSEVLGNCHLAGDGIFTKRCHEWLEQNTRSSKALLTHSCTAAWRTHGFPLRSVAFLSGRAPVRTRERKPSRHRECSASCLRLPLRVGITEQQQSYVVELLIKALNSASGPSPAVPRT